MLDIVDQIMNLARQLVDLLKVLADRWGRAKKSTQLSLAIAATVVVAGGILLLGFHLGGQNPGVAPAQSGPTQDAVPKRIGGLDLARYCQSYEYDTNSEEFCTSGINLDEACNWQYERNDLHGRFTSNNPSSGVCFDSSEVPLGGVSDMPRYCESAFKKSIDVEAKVVNETWVCQTRIDMRLACTWEYQRYDLEARKDAAGNWSCYE
jgi:hypothetical protein